MTDDVRDEGCPGLADDYDEGNDGNQVDKAGPVLGDDRDEDGDDRYF